MKCQPSHSLPDSTDPTNRNERMKAAPKPSLATAAVIIALTVMVPAHAQQEAAASADDAAELAKKLQNPVAALISVPIKLDWDTGTGSAGADRSTPTPLTLPEGKWTAPPLKRAG